MRRSDNMNNNQKWFYLTKNLKSSLLSDEQDTLLTRHMKIKDIHKLHYIISLQMINGSNCLFRSGLQLLRWVLFIPIIIILLFNSICFLNYFQSDWDNTERKTLSIINELDSTHYISEGISGYYLYKEDDDEFREKQANYLGGDKKMDLKEYMYFRYNIYAYGHRYFITDIIHVVCFFILVPLFFIYHF